MSANLGNLASIILLRNFGEIVQKVGDDLWKNRSKPIGMIVQSTGLSRALVIESLRTLLKFDLAVFEAAPNELQAYYKLVPENVLLLMRYPRYLLQIKTKYGNAAELIVEELLQKATCTSTVLLVTIATKYKDDKEKNITVVSLKDVFISLVTASYIQQAPVAEIKDGSEVPTLTPVATIVPDIDCRMLLQVMSAGNFNDVKDNIYWRVNYDRFHQDFRDELMIKAVTRRFDENAGELMRFVLEQMYLSSSAWAPESNPVCAIDVRNRCQSAATDKPLLQQYVDQYFKVLEESGEGFIRKCEDAHGGQYCVRLRATSHLLLHSVVEQLVSQRLGAKAARIYRLIRERGCTEQDDIQKNAMLGNKECKQLTYKLLQENFISVQALRKPAAGNSMKAIHLFDVTLKDVATKALQMTYLGLHNIVRRAEHELRLHSRLVHKQRRVRSIVHGMRLRGEEAQSIQDVEETLTAVDLAVLKTVEKRLKQLSAAELELDRDLFIFQWYFMYPET